MMYTGPSEPMSEADVKEWYTVLYAEADAYWESINKESQALGEPGGAEAYEDLVRAARWVLARFTRTRVWLIGRGSFSSRLAKSGIVSKYTEK